MVDENNPSQKATPLQTPFNGLIIHVVMKEELQY